MNHWADYIIFVLFIGVSLGIGLYHALTGGRQRTTAEFIMADRKLKVIPTALSMLVTYQSAIMILGFTAEIYTGGTQAWIMILISYALSIVIVERFIVPWLYPLKLTSVFKFFEIRFESRDIRIFGALLGIVSTILYIGTSILAPSLALETATGFPAYASIPVMAAVCTIYTALGGMKAVIWTDVFQSVVMVTGMLTVMIKGFVVVGGIKSAFHLLHTEGRLTLADFSPDPTVRHTVWGFLFGWTLMWVSQYGTGQSCVQRYSAVETIKNARTVILLNLPAVWLMTSISFLTGVAVVAYFTQLQCDPIASGQIRQANQLLPLFVRDIFKSVPGFPGLFMATLYSGALSTVSSGLSAVATNTWDDILRWKLSHISDYQASLVNKGLVVFYGCAATGIAFLVATMTGTIVQIAVSIGSAVSGPLFGLFVISSRRLFYFTNRLCAITGGLVGFALTFWLNMGARTVNDKHQPLLPVSVANCTSYVNVTLSSYKPPQGLRMFYSVSYLWYGVFGCLNTIIVGLCLSACVHAFYKTEKDKRKWNEVPSDKSTREILMQKM